MVLPSVPARGADLGVGACEGPCPGTVPDRPDRGLGQRSHPDPADVDGGGQGQGPAESGHPEDRAVGLAEKDAPEGQPAEGPGHPHRLGEGQRGRKGQCPGEGRPGGTARQATAMKPASRAMSTMAPGPVNDRTHIRPGT